MAVEAVGAAGCDMLVVHEVAVVGSFRDALRLKLNASGGGYTATAYTDTYHDAYEYTVTTYGNAYRNAYEYTGAAYADVDSDRQHSGY